MRTPVRRYAGGPHRGIDQKVKALEGVLTPDQLARYRQLQQQQMSFVKKLMPQLKAPPAE